MSGDSGDSVDSVEQRNCPRCPYQAVLIQHEDGPWWFCTRCGWGDDLTLSGASEGADQ